MRLFSSTFFSIFGLKTFGPVSVTLSLGGGTYGCVGGFPGGVGGFCCGVDGFQGSFGGCCVGVPGGEYVEVLGDSSGSILIPS